MTSRPRLATLILFVAVFAAGVFGAGQTSARAADPPLVFYDILVRSAIHSPQAGDPAQAYVNGIPCGTGLVDGANPATSIFNPIFIVPSTCAQPGDTVAFLVNGYMLAGTAVYPVDPAGFDTPVTFRTRLGPVFSARFAGFTSLPLGTTVEARIGGVICGSATVQPLGSYLRFYNLSVDPTLPAPWGTLGCGFPDAVVTLWAGGIQVGVGAWRSGFTLLNL